MSYSEQSKKALESMPLKQIYPEVQQRIKHREKKLSQCKLVNPILVRIEPFEKQTLPQIYISMAMDKKTKLAQVCSYLHKKVFKLGATASLFLFCKKSLVTLHHTVEELLLKNNEGDGILYLIYADNNNPFGH